MAQLNRSPQPSAITVYPSNLQRYQQSHSSHHCSSRHQHAKVATEARTHCCRLPAEHFSASRRCRTGHPSAKNRRHWHDKDYCFKISVRAALRDRGEAAQAAILDELQGILDKGVWHGVNMRDLTSEQRKRCSYRLRYGRSSGRNLGGVDTGYLSYSRHDNSPSE